MVSSRRDKSRGLTLVEICVVLCLVLMVMTLSLTAMKPAAEKGSTLGLATALKEEFEAARQLAMRGGHPVAVGIPTQGNLAASSVYRLSGWNTPYVDQSVGFSGDYPRLGFAAATWSGAPAIGTSMAPPSSAKFFTFGEPQLAAWLTSSAGHDYSQDYIFCYLPDGSLITNGLPTSDGRYPLVVAGNPTFAGTAPSAVEIDSGTNPWTLLISPHGAVDLVNGTPGGNLPAGAGAGTVSNPRARTQSDPEDAQIYLSELNIRPVPDPALPDESICVPGEIVTMEIFAHCPQGDELFANWTQVPGSSTNFVGTFTHPNQDGSALDNEADRMEFLPPNRIPTEAGFAPIWRAGEEPPANTGIWRAQWSWTVPVNTVPGELFDVTVNVQNAQDDATIMTNPRPKFGSRPSPAGSLIVERRVNGLWQLWRMNPNGTGERLLSPEGIQEMMPSLDRFGTQMALIRQGPGGITDRHIVIRSINGGSEKILTAAPGKYTSVSLSPLGDWVAYRDDAAGNLIAVRTDGSGSLPPIPQIATAAHGYEVNKFRTGWSQDGRYMLYENQLTIHSYNLSTGTDTQLWGPYAPMSNGNIPWVYAPTSYTHNGREYVVLSNTTNKPFLLTFEVTDYETTHDSNFDATSSDRRVRDLGPNIGDWTNGVSTNYADVSQDGKLVFTRSPGWNMGDSVVGEEENNMQVYILPNITADGVFYGPPQVMSLTDVRRAIFIPPSE